MNQHPADITCIQCKTSLRRSGFTHTDIVYSCLCGATTRTSPRGKRIPVQRGGPRPPDSAA